MANEDQTIVINDLLSFASCKIKKISKLSIKQNIENFYSKEEIDDAVKTLESALEPTVTFKTNENPIDYVLKVLNRTSDEDMPIFVCKDLNNVPNFKANRVKASITKPLKPPKEDFMVEHTRLKEQLQKLFDSLYEVKKQYETVAGKKIDISEFEKKAEKFVDVKKKPLVKDLNYLQSLIDEEGDNEIVLENTADVSDNVDDIVQQRINLIANRRQRASLRLTKKSIDEKYKSEPMDYNEAIDHEFSDEAKRKIIVDTIYDDSRKISRSIYRCSFCAFRTTDKDSARNHTCEAQIKTSLKSKRKPVPRFIMVEHHFDETLGVYPLYKCSACTFCSNDETSVAEHECIKISYEKSLNGSQRLAMYGTRPKRTHKRQKSYDCHNCGASFKMRKELQKHIESHLGEGHRCPLCGDRFALENWLDHVRGCPGDGSTSLEDHYCEVCDVFYADKRTLSFHRAFHDPSRPFQCIECKFRFYTQKTVEDHYRTHGLHRNSNKCPFCDFRAFKTAKIVDHIRCHTGDRPYKCPQCERSCTTYNALKVHLTSHAPERDFPCDICGKKFKSQNKVASHRKIHNMERPHKCPVCGKGFKFGLQMALHHRMHLDIRKHACTLCPYKARTAAVLRGHMNTHTKAKPYKCSQCDFGANHKSYLNWHIKCYHPKPDQLVED